MKHLKTKQNNNLKKNNLMFENKLHEMNDILHFKLTLGVTYLEMISILLKSPFMFPYFSKFLYLHYHWNLTQEKNLFS
jgi:hypothetical protein